jgi:hypothetical protein
MASSNKRKTTMAKLNRERGLAERRLEKQAKKAARKEAAAQHEQAPAPAATDDAGRPLADEPAVDAATQPAGATDGADAENQDMDSASN